RRAIVNPIGSQIAPTVHVSCAAAPPAASATLRSNGRPAFGGRQSLRCQMKPTHTGSILPRRASGQACRNSPARQSNPHIAWQRNSGGTALDPHSTCCVWPADARPLSPLESDFSAGPDNSATHCPLPASPAGHELPSQQLRVAENRPTGRNRRPESADSGQLRAGHQLYSGRPASPTLSASSSSAAATAAWRPPASGWSSAISAGEVQARRLHHGGRVEPGAPLSREGLQPDPVVYSVRGPVRSSIPAATEPLQKPGGPVQHRPWQAVDSAVRVTNLANLPSSESSDMTKRLDLELVMRANFSLANGRYFYTDANSAALAAQAGEGPFESGVYPVTGAVVLCGSAGRGGRRRRDDSRGVGQAMERVYPARSDFLLHWSTQSAADSTDANNNDERLVGDFLTPAELALSRRLNHRPLAFLTLVQLSLLPPAGLPCSLEIVTYRLLPPGHRFQALLVLHNQPSVCHKTGNGEQQQQQQPCKAKVGFCLADLFTRWSGRGGPSSAQPSSRGDPHGAAADPASGGPERAAAIGRLLLRHFSIAIRWIALTRVVCFSS
uniref:Velvet domain-containing protein n=1 Tax=Macrostomum lignano TaxID=282301 RepID=A0A1I8F8W0_9PLAT